MTFFSPYKAFQTIGVGGSRFPWKVVLNLTSTLQCPHFHMEANLPDSTTNKQNNNKLYLHFTFNIIIVTEGSFSLTVRYYAI